MNRNQTAEIGVNGFDDLTFIRLDQKEQAFSRVLQPVEADSLAKRQQPGHENTPEFFSDNIASLLNVAADVRRIEIKRRRAKNLLEEEIDFVLKNGLPVTTD